MSLFTPTVAPTLAPEFELKLSPEFTSPGSSTACCPGSCNCFSSQFSQSFENKPVVVTQQGVIKPASKKTCWSTLFDRCCCCFSRCLGNKVKENEHQITPEQFKQYLMQKHGEQVANIVDTYLYQEMQMKDKDIRVIHVQNGIEKADSISAIKRGVKVAQFHLLLNRTESKEDDFLENEENDSSEGISIQVIKDNNSLEEFKEEIIEKDLKDLGIEEEYIGNITPRIKQKIIQLKKHEKEDDNIVITPKEITSIIVSELKMQNYQSPIRTEEYNDDIIEILEEKKSSNFTLQDFKKLETTNFIAKKANSAPENRSRKTKLYKIESKRTLKEEHIEINEDGSFI